MSGVVVAAAVACAVALLVLPPTTPSTTASAVPDPPADREDLGLLRRGRVAWALLAGAGCAVVLGGPAAPVAGLVVAGVVGVAAGRLEPPAVRRRREEVGRDLPYVVCLLGAALRAGAAPAGAVDLACRALPGAAADRLRPVVARLELGGDPVAVWDGLAADPALAPLGRTMARTHRTGAPVVAAVDRLGEDLARRARADVEDRARAVGVRAAVPLGVCLLPAFLLLGIVPLVAGLVGAIDW
ncbi:MAG TPA: type II secretion system F family protein [Nocardioides sp.]|nr:type II secretion system F family protein [Nocardioides sp.]